MSTNLYWQPVRNHSDRGLSKSLKFKIARKYWGHDGSLCGDAVTLGADDALYLEGIRDGSDEEAAQDAAVLIDAIHQFGEIEIEIL